MSEKSEKSNRKKQSRLDAPFAFDEQRGYRLFPTLPTRFRQCAAASLFTFGSMVYQSSVRKPRTGSPSRLNRLAQASGQVQA